MDFKSSLVLLLVLVAVESVLCRNVPQTSSDEPGKEVVFTPFFDKEGNPSHGPAVITLQVSDGTQVDCVPVQHQPSAHLPSLKGHSVQIQDTTMAHQPDSEVAACEQRFREEHGSCPEGTIAIARQKEVHGRRLGEFPGTMRATSNSDNDTLSTNLYSEIVLDLGFVSADITWYGPSDPFNFIGYGATLSVQQPYIEPGYPSASMSRIMIGITYWKNPTSGLREFAGSGHITAGFSVNPSAGDSLPRFFTAWSVVVPEAREAVGCVNTLCPGYTHLSPNVVLGAPITGPEMSLYIVLDYSTYQYKLYYGTELVGFWTYADTLGYRIQHFTVDLGLGAYNGMNSGGIVMPLLTNGRVTNTHMGTGKYSSEVGAAYVRNVQWLSKTDNSWYQVPTTGLYQAGTYANVPPQCYDAYLGNGDRVDWGTYLLYGGRGGENAACRV